MHWLTHHEVTSASFGVGTVWGWFQSPAAYDFVARIVFTTLSGILISAGVAVVRALGVWLMRAIAKCCARAFAKIFNRP